MRISVKKILGLVLVQASASHASSGELTSLYDGHEAHFHKRERQAIREALVAIGADFQSQKKLILVNAEERQALREVIAQLLQRRAQTTHTKESRDVGIR